MGPCSSFKRVAFLACTAGIKFCTNHQAASCSVPLSNGTRRCDAIGNCRNALPVLGRGMRKARRDSRSRGSLNRWRGLRELWDCGKGEVTIRSVLALGFGIQGCKSAPDLGYGSMIEIRSHSLKAKLIKFSLCNDGVTLTNGSHSHV